MVFFNWGVFINRNSGLVVHMGWAMRLFNLSWRVLLKSPWVLGHRRMQKAFEEASFALKVGELSEVVSTDSGEHLILRIQ